jgi:HTH-type transcriptional regulator / antitoxin HipB
VIYPIKTLSQLPLILRGFRKEKKLTQAAMAERLNIAQQSYAYFEANPAIATLERLFTVLRMLDVEISLNQTSLAISKSDASSAKVANRYSSTGQVVARKIAKKPSAVTTRKIKPSSVARYRSIAPTRKRESW